MGLYNRDYYRDDNNAFGFGAETPTCRLIVIITAITMIIELLWRDGGSFMSRSVLEEWCSLDEHTVTRGQIWRPLTYFFLHPTYSPWPILGNMIILWFFGGRIERVRGSREFLVFYVAAALFCAAIYLLSTLTLGPVEPIIGATGPVLATAMVLTMLTPRETCMVFGLIPVELRLIMLVVVILEAFPILSMIGTSGDVAGFAYAAPLWGVLFGWMYYAFGWHLESLVNVWSRIREARLAAKARQRFSIVGDDENKNTTDAEVDRILAKIHEQGEASLTAKERKTLEAASRRYRS